MLGRARMPVPKFVCGVVYAFCFASSMVIMDILTIDKTEFHFRSRRGFEDLTAEFIEVVRKYQNAVLRALKDMENTPKELDVIMTHRIDEAKGEFRMAPWRIVLNAEWLRKLKEICIDLETAHYEMMHTFLHELAHWITKDDAEAEELASE